MTIWGLEETQNVGWYFEGQGKVGAFFEWPNVLPIYTSLITKD